MMPLADFFDRTAQSIMQVVKAIDYDSLEDRLNRVRIGIAFGDQALSHDNGPLSLEFATNLFSRLYPHLGIVYSGETVQGLALQNRLQAMAKEINPNIEFTGRTLELDYLLCVGATLATARVPVWVWSDAWNLEVSTSGPADSLRGNAVNPFSAAAAAALGAAEVFARVFQIPSPAHGSESFIMSLLTYERTPSPSLQLPPIHLEDLVLVGVGAVGNSVVWCLRYVPKLSGSVSLVDDEAIELTNLQRYVLTKRQSVGDSKVDLAKQSLHRTGLTVQAHSSKFGDYVQTNRPNCDFEMIAVAVDNAQDRIAAQAVLPRLALNAWTGEGGWLGISRHGFDEKQACLACLYLATGKRKSRAEEIADVTGLDVRMVGHMLVNHVPITRDIIGEIAVAKEYPLDLLARWEGQTLDQFYSQAVCGGALLKLGLQTRQSRNTLVPLAHQSALAGVLLGCEIAKHALGLVPANRPVEARLNLLASLPTYIACPRGKTTSPPCLCKDADYIRAYRHKWKTVTTTKP